MTASYSADAVALARVRRGTVELTQCAENMTVGSGSLTYNDTAGTLAIVGQMDFAADEDACANPILFRGFVGTRSFSRKSERKSLAREIDFELHDLNAMAGFRLIGADGNRPAETVAQRGAWLMASAYVTGLFTDEGRCEFPDLGIDKADYRNQFPGDVLADMFLAALGYNAYIRDFGDGPEQVFRNDNTSTADTIDLRISNVISDVTGDVSGLTFYPLKDAVLRRDPSQVISKLAYSSAMGTVIKERAATATAFNGERGGTASNANVKTASKAAAEAVAILWQRSTEEDTIECTIQVPSSAVNLVNHGDRMQARFSHLTPEGYGSMTWFRVLEATKHPLLRPVDKYNVRLRLSPQEEAEPTCSFPATPSGTYFPLGGHQIPDDWGASNPSDGVVYYWRPGISGVPVTPNPGQPGKWHFPAYGSLTGGMGTIDTMGSCVQNRLIFIVVGNGTMTIQTEGIASRKFNLWSGTPGDGGMGNFHGRFGGGSSQVVVIDDTSVPDDCVRIVQITDIGSQADGETCGDPPLGWSSMTWVAA